MDRLLLVTQQIDRLPALGTIVAMVGCSANEEDTSAAVTFRVIVTGLDSSETSFEYTTSAASVGEALVAEDLIEDHETEYGLTLTKG